MRLWRRSPEAGVEQKKPVDPKTTNVGLGVAMGAGIGLTLGLAFWGADGIPLGAGVGAGVGVALSAAFDEMSRRGRE